MITTHLFLFFYASGASGGATVEVGLPFVGRDRLHFTVVATPLHFTALGRLHFSVEDDG